MKKALICLLILGLSATLASAQQLIGRSAGMGGAGVAVADDISAAYYNPAGLMQSSVMAGEFMVAYGAAYTDLNKLTTALGKFNDPAQFLLDNYANNLSFNGSANGLIGLNIRKVGLSLIPNLLANVNKPANTLAGTFVGSGVNATVLTLGQTYSLSYLPAALDVGLNVKLLHAASGNITTTMASATTAVGTQTYGSGTGMGYDLGVLTTVNIPMVSKIAVGAVMRDIATGYNIKPNSRVATLDAVANTVTLGPETAGAEQTYTVDGSTAIGAYATIPGVGLGIAADLEFTRNDGTNTHLGVEYPIMMGAVVLQAGSATGNSLGLTTLGARANLGVTKVGIVSVADSKNSGLTRTAADITVAF